MSETEETEATTNPADAIQNVRDALDPVLDVMESLAGVDRGTIVITDVFGTRHEVSDQLSLYHEMAGTRALRKLQRVKLDEETTAEIEQAWNTSPAHGVLAVAQAAGLDDEMARHLDLVFEGFHGDTPITEDVQIRRLLTALRESARQAVAEQGGDPDHAPTQVRHLLGAGEIVRALLPFFRSIVDALKVLQGNKPRA